MINYAASATKKLTEDLPKHSNIVIEWNCQGAFGVSFLERQFKKTFPETIAHMSSVSASGKLTTGQVLVFQENDYNIYVMINRYALVGRLKDDYETVLATTQRTIISLKQLVGMGNVYSWMLIKDTGFWSNVHRQLKNMDINWNIYHR